MSRFNGLPKILVFAGSARADSFNRKLARAAASALAAEGAEVTVAELRDYPLPLYDGDLEAAQGLPERAKAFQELLRSYDALAIATPEHNGAYPALLKNALDWASRPDANGRHSTAFRGKTALLLSASPGPGGGRRAIQHLRALLEALGVTVIARQVAVARAFEAFDREGKLTRSEDAAAVRMAAAELAAAVRQSNGNGMAA